MKRLPLLIAALFIFSIFSSSSILASPPRLVYRVDSGIVFFYQYVLPVIAGYWTGKESPAINADGSNVILGGDADDTANGKDDLIGDDRDETKERLTSSLGDDLKGDCIYRMRTN